MRKSEAKRTPKRTELVHTPLELLRTAVKEAGVKMTPQRLEILRFIAGSEAHPDAETIFRAVQKRMPTVSLDTVYRTMWMLRDLGLVTTLGSPSRAGGDAVRFDTNVGHHHHYVCVRCGLIRDFESPEMNDIRVPDSVSSFGAIVDARVEIRGICTSCQ